MISKDDKPPPPTPDSDSLVRRLAGPSTNKAGLAKDQSEVNRVIAEASKGSKFYENEKRKDKDLTERIERILKHRDEVTKGVDLRSVEQTVDKLIAQLEAQRDLSQIIVHVDMDAFFANVEVLDNPELASKPFGVGHGILTTASYEARKFGVRSGMPTFIAKKLCPELVVVAIHPRRYSEKSDEVMAIFRRFDPNMAAAGCDEGYLNLTAYCEEHLLTADECVAEIRRVVHEETKLTVSAGIAPNKMLAKICSDKNKPNGQFKLDFEPQAIKAFMHDLSIRKVPGVGRVNERLLESIGIKTCGDIYAQRAILSLLDKQFGLLFLLQAYLGIASNVVEAWQREEKKSIGAERTFNPISDTAKIYDKLEEVAAELSDDMTEGGWTGKTITLKYKLDTYKVFTRAKSMDKWVSTRKEDLFTIGKELLKPELPLTLRLIGLRVSKLKDMKAEAESKARGIKRFFNAAPGSPSKRRRVDVSETGEQRDEVPHLSQDGFATTMPGYFEEVEADADHIAEVADVDEDVEADGSTIPNTKPKSTSSRQGPDSSAPPPMPGPSRDSAPGSSKPTSSSAGSHRKPVSIRTDHDRIPEGGGGDSSSGHGLLECPICSKMLQTDNEGLNAHIDFCLSKQAIKEAQAASLEQSAQRAGSSKTSVRPSNKKKPPNGPREGVLNFRKKTQ